MLTFRHFIKKKTVHKKLYKMSYFKVAKSATMNIFRSFLFIFKSFVKVELSYVFTINLFTELSYVFTINLFTIAENCTEK